VSRSYRKTPITSSTSSSSDKEFKRQQHRARRVRERIIIALLGEDTDPCDMPYDKEYGDPWCSPKDGKQYIDTDSMPQEEFNKLMRK
jgi:hypothetical protein